VARLLFEAPFAVLAHNAAEEPAFTYANKVMMYLL
jgi:MEKHLA domain